jgi:hypothetical protein
MTKKSNYLGCVAAGLFAVMAFTGSAQTASAGEVAADAARETQASSNSQTKCKKVRKSIGGRKCNPNTQVKCINNRGIAKCVICDGGKFTRSKATGCLKGYKSIPLEQAEKNPYPDSVFDGEATSELEEESYGLQAVEDMLYLER